MGGRRLPLWLEPIVREVRLTLVGLACATGDLLRRRRLHAPLLRAAWRPGVSVLIPERGTPDLLAQALASLVPALARVGEPTEIIVVVNGATPADYAGLQRQFPNVVWQFHGAALGFTGALAQGLAAVRHGAVYLHNSDMVIADDALALLLPWRARHIFAIASQIFFADPAKRREETGWGDLQLESGRARLFDRTPEPDGRVRGGLYAGGGSSLFDTTLLRRFAGNTQGYAPFYWEDADWGLQAWRHGLEVLFHPESVAWHRHRATISRHYAAAEIDRIVARNGLLFELRNFPDTTLARRAANEADWPTVKDLARPVTLAEIVRQRAARARFTDIDIETTSRHVHCRPAAADPRPLVLVVSPYRVLPPRHGSAWRTWRLCEALATRWRFMLLCDEANGHDASSWARMGPFDSVHLVGGRPDGPGDRIGRIGSHSHAALQTELDRLVAVYQPDIVQIEHVELSALRVPRAAPSLIVAHDVLLGSDGQHDADRFELERMAAFDAIVVCSKEDAALLSPLPATVVPNGARVDLPCSPSAGQSTLLFAGPFRYAPNRLGLRLFLELVFPALRERFPALGLTVLAGEAGRAAVAGDPLFEQPGIEIHDAVDDVRPWLERSALTINPLLSTRGSSLKLIESLAAGRVCVSTADGARGFLDAALPGLLVAPNIPGMLEPLARMLADEPARLRLERPDADALRGFSWDHAALAQDRVYTALKARERA
jgi:GT2 family glycosyltransferase